MKHEYIQYMDRYFSDLLQLSTISVRLLQTLERFRKEQIQKAKVRERMNFWVEEGSILSLGSKVGFN